ncbi:MULTISPECIES: glycosyltransferase family 2 protein [unclassified Shewanella]|uniref:glycosyltransferase family 2 protein n=1 Tax=unclassified Shewanella TaxID=196818 RepID=UPI00200385D8|nr:MULTISPECIES: glycosyltransferase family 2 protein [unclassified Shewanella]MCK7634357.1 glycosyltransferase family 2 protein [Shewanella sp. JNE17]MCK7649643.1 glycosyltransferase family 2 protein [Shewanella sp. JNE8]MCK7657786.1 glycosyltransferase family 2 protein [Shewanella sp. JNE4-2]UPO30000.1 glycosyltransferase family 2 protein [Shewanella sp. JNE2]
MSKENKEVIILLAAYNGEQYVKEQLDSIVNQDYTYFRVLMSDDGSSDRTVRILKDYALKDDRFIFLNSNRKGGVVGNFCYLLREVSNYSNVIYMFSDQDDYWLPDKISQSLSFFEEHSKNLPTVLYTNLKVVDKKLNVINEDFYRYTKVDPNRNSNKMNIKWVSSVYGCTVMFNKSLLDIMLDFPRSITMHDHWAAVCAVKYGQLIFLDRPTLLYRQHDNNQVGAIRNGIFGKLKQVKSLIARMRKYKSSVISMNVTDVSTMKARIKCAREIAVLNGVSTPYKLVLAFFVLFDKEDK